MTDDMRWLLLRDKPSERLDMCLCTSGYDFRVALLTNHAQSNNLKIQLKRIC